MSDSYQGMLYTMVLISPWHCIVWKPHLHWFSIGATALSGRLCVSTNVRAVIVDHCKLICHATAVDGERGRLTIFIFPPETRQQRRSLETRKKTDWGTDCSNIVLGSKVKVERVVFATLHERAVFIQVTGSCGNASVSSQHCVCRNVLRCDSCKTAWNASFVGFVQVVSLVSDAPHLYKRPART